MGGKHTGLPHLSLLNLTITQQGVDPGGFALVLQSQRHTAGAGNALSQRAGGHIHPGNGIHIGMALKVGINMPQGGQILHREEAPIGQSRVQAGGRMTLAQHETVTILPLGILGIDVHFFKIQVGEHIRSGQAAAGMTRFRAVSTLDNPHAHLAGHFLKN